MNRFLDWLFPIRREALAEADELMEAYGDQAYYVARALGRDALLSGDTRKHKLYSRARLHIAKLTHHPVGLDTATALLNEDVRDLVKPRDATLH